MEEICTIEDYKNFIQNKEAIVIFYTKWCPVCKMLVFEMEEYLAKHPEISIKRINSSEYPEIAKQLGIFSVPTTLFYNRGKILEKRQGMIDLEDFEEIILSLKDEFI